MTRGINEVDLRSLPHHLGSLSKNGDTTFAFLVVGVHNAVDYGSMGGKRTGRTQQGVEKCGFSVVYVGNERNIAQILWFFGHVGGW